ncbi:Phospholipase D [Denitrovibrio acetiphilus DSM 12809]|uniref:Phospholipase D n=1 Tax=Denitrovibrio acetiphilus (strain DSM 12809 / NBRC 114555 / N2460) TaxID=522772 RepID=D4H507_DENA2|nr:VTT domain-containing protein [Denitrovibrio acetiphilus]ADD69363.1 Phospholipase D [Denitrovibrio acetiphilus DSM 12809]
MYSSDPSPILKPGRNCWKLTKTNRLAPLIDGENYYRAVADAISNAKETVFITAWDIDSRIRLIRGEENITLTDVLTKACQNNPRLRIFILSWDFAMLYAMEREKLMGLKWNLATPESIRFVLDNECPFAASHHQKLVIVDDALAYVGGMDISNSRWDTREHKENNPLRRDPMDENYIPYHDVMFAVDGDAAMSLSELFRRRWYTATGEKLPIAQQQSDPMPGWIKPVITDTEIAISRTYPAYKTNSEIREIEKTYLEIIKRAEKYIYIENQYFTSHSIYLALKERLKSDNCPEILLVIPKKSPGWLEEATMVNIRSVYIRQLKIADKRNRISFMRPHNGAAGEGFMNIHSKLIIADDEILFVGSANLSNRSMGFDTEVNIAFESGANDDKRKAIHNFMTDLLGEHLGTSPEKTSEMLKETGSLFTTVDKLSKNGRRLMHIPNKNTFFFEKLFPDSRYLDPEKPALLDRTVDKFVTPARKDMDILNNLKYFRFFMFVLTLVLIALLWKFTPLKEYTDKETLTALIKTVQNSPGSHFIVIGGFAVLGMLMMPVTVLISTVAAFYEPVTAFLISMTGSVISASLMYILGSAAGGKTAERVLGPKSKHIRNVLRGKGTLTIAILRLIPVAPFTVVNAAAGAFKVGGRKFAMGTAIGMTPGIIAVTAVTNRFIKSIFEPTPLNISILIAAAVTFFAAGYYISKRLRANAPDDVK